MKVAIVHDWLVWSGGAERVLERLLTIYPEADLFALVDFYPQADRQSFLHGKHAKTTFIQSLPLAEKHFRSYLPLFPMAIESLDLSGYDLVISSSHAVAKGVKTLPGQVHLCYCYTPMRYAWDREEEYYREHRIGRIKRGLLRYLFHKIRIWDTVSSHRVDQFIAISALIQERIRRYYGREAFLLHPPVNTGRFALETEKEEYFFTASRLVPYKKVALIVEAFAKNGRPLIVAGEGPELEKIRTLATDNVTILGKCSDEEIVAYMQKARAFVYAAYEDFGIVPVEAMACGTPVVAFGQGGIQDTVIDGATGVFFMEQSAASIDAALSRFESIQFDYAKIREHALNFDETLFNQRFRELADSWIDSSS